MMQMSVFTVQQLLSDVIRLVYITPADRFFFLYSSFWYTSGSLLLPPPTAVLIQTLSEVAHICFRSSSRALQADTWRTPCSELLPGGILSSPHGEGLTAQQPWTETCVVCNRYPPESLYVNCSLHLSSVWEPSITPPSFLH